MSYTMTKHIHFGGYSQNIFLKSEQYSARCVELKHTTIKTSQSDPFFTMHHSFNVFFPACKFAQASISNDYLDFVDIHQWFWASLNDVNVRRDDIDRNFIVHVWIRKFSKNCF